MALVLPGEEAALPDVGEAVPSPGLLDPALEGVLLAGGIGLVGGGLPHHPAQVDEVLLGRGLLGRGGAAPFLREGGRGQGGGAHDGEGVTVNGCMRCGTNRKV